MQVEIGERLPKREITKIKIKTFSSLRIKRESGFIHI